MTPRKIIPFWPDEKYAASLSLPDYMEFFKPE